MNNDCSLSIVLPVYNEQDTIRRTIGDTLDFLNGQDSIGKYEIIVVDDGSSDQTADILKDLARELCSMNIITNPRNLGYGGALVSGIKKTKFPWVFLMDADGQFKINSLEPMLRKMEMYDIITGFRYKRADSLYRDILGKVYNWCACSVFGLHLKDINCGFKLFKKDALNFEGAVCHAGVFYTELFIKAKENRLKIHEVPVEHFPRCGGKQTGANGVVIAQAILDLLRLRFFTGK